MTIMTEQSDRDELLEKLGVSDVGYLPDEEAPPIDEDLLRRLVHHELSDDESLAVCRNLASYRCWSKAYTEILLAEGDASQDDETAFSDDEETNPFVEAIGRIRANLRPGGPDVDYAALHLHIAGDLDAEQSRQVRELIVTWQPWYDAYWETVSALSEAESLDLEPKNLFEEFGLEHEYKSEEEAPPVEKDLLARMARKEVTKDEADRVYSLITRFRSWHQAYIEALIAEMSLRRSEKEK